MDKISEEVRKKGYTLFKNGNVKKELETAKRIHFKVVGETETHSVIFDKIKNEWGCDCRFFALKERGCSHIYAAKLKESQ